MTGTTTEHDVEPTPVLKQGVLYLAHDRFVCARVPCAGMSALYTGYTIGGARVTRATAADKREWESYGLGPMTCECGAVKM
jgi:hypothetical protein